MSHSIDPNPYAAPQSNVGEASLPSATGADFLKRTEIELARTKVGIVILAWSLLFVAGIGFATILFQVPFKIGLPALIVKFLTIGFYLVTGVILLSCERRIRDFSRHEHPKYIPHFFRGHAAYWKFTGICMILITVLVILLAIGFSA